jgi:hypothetical protein
MIPPVEVTGVHAIIVEIVVPQAEMSRFTITVDVSSTMLWPSCWWRSGGSRDLFRLQHAHGFFHDALKHHGELILHFAWVGWRHCVCEEDSKNVMGGVWNELKQWGSIYMVVDDEIYFFGFFGAITVKTASFSV